MFSKLNVSHLFIDIGPEQWESFMNNGHGIGTGGLPGPGLTQESPITLLPVLSDASVLKRDILILPVLFLSGLHFFVCLFLCLVITCMYLSICAPDPSILCCLG